MRRPAARGAGRGRSPIALLAGTADGRVQPHGLPQEALLVTPRAGALLDRHGDELGAVGGFHPQQHRAAAFLRAPSIALTRSLADSPAGRRPRRSRRPDETPSAPPRHRDRRRSRRGPAPPAPRTSEAGATSMPRLATCASPPAPPPMASSSTRASFVVRQLAERQLRRSSRSRCGDRSDRPSCSGPARQSCAQARAASSIFSPLTATMTSPDFIPAASAGAPFCGCAISAPLVDFRPRLSAMSWRHRLDLHADPAARHRRPCP